MLHPIGAIKDNSFTSNQLNGTESVFTEHTLKNGLIGFFPSCTPLVNIITPTYISEIENYNYAFDRIANPNSTKNISDKMRWQNSSYAIKGNIGTKTTSTIYSQCPKFFAYEYLTENEFSFSAIVNKHGNSITTYNGNTKFIFDFNNEKKIIIDISNDRIDVSYARLLDDFSLSEIINSTYITKKTQIEHITITLKRTNFNEYIIYVYENTGKTIVSYTISNVLFEKTFSIYSSGSYEISNMRVYDRQLTKEEHSIMVSIGDCKSIIYLDNSEGNYSAEYDISNTRILTNMSNIDELFPIGTNRIISFGKYAINNTTYISNGNASVNPVLDVIGLNSSAPAYSANIANKMIPYIDNISAKAKFPFENEDNIFVFDGGNINEVREFAAPYSEESFIRDMVKGNSNIFFGIIHHGYIFSTIQDSNIRFIKRIKNPYTNIDGMGTRIINNALNIVSPNDKIEVSNSTITVVNDVSESNVPMSIDIYYYNYSTRKYQLIRTINYTLGFALSTINLSSELSGITIPRGSLSCLISVRTYNSTEILLIKNIEVYDAAKSIQPFEYAKNYSGAINKYISSTDSDEVIIRSSTIGYTESNRVNIDSMFIYKEGVLIKTDNGNTSNMFYEYRDNLKPQNQRYAQTFVLEKRGSGAYLQNQIILSDDGVYSDIKRIYNNYMNLNYGSSLNYLENSNIFNDIEKSYLGNNEKAKSGNINITNCNRNPIRVVIDTNYSSNGNLDSSIIVGSTYVKGAYYNEIWITLSDNSKIVLVKITDTNEVSYIYMILLDFSNQVLSIVNKYDASIIQYNLSGYIQNSGILKHIDSFTIYLKGGDTGIEIANSSLYTHTSFNMSYLTTESISSIDIFSKNDSSIYEICEFNNHKYNRLNSFNYVFEYDIPSYGMLPRNTIVSNSYSIELYSNTVTGVKNIHNNRIRASIEGYGENSYNHTNVLETYAYSIGYGFNKFTHETTEILPQGYCWCEDDDSSNPKSNPYANIKLDYTTEKQEVEYYTTNKSSNFEFYLEHIKSTVLDIGSGGYKKYIIINDFYELYNSINDEEVALYIRHPITKKIVKNIIYILDSYSNEYLNGKISVSILDNYSVQYTANSNLFIDIGYIDSQKVGSIIRQQNQTNKFIFHEGLGDIVERTSDYIKINSIGWYLPNIKVFSNVNNNVLFENEFVDNIRNLFGNSQMLAKVIYDSNMYNYNFTTALNMSSSIYSITGNNSCIIVVHGVDMLFNWTKITTLFLNKNDIVFSYKLDSNRYPIIEKTSNYTIYEVSGNIVQSDKKIEELFKDINDNGNFYFYNYISQDKKTKKWTMQINPVNKYNVVFNKDDTINLYDNALEEYDINIIKNNISIPYQDYTTKEFLYNSYIVNSMLDENDRKYNLCIVVPLKYSINTYSDREDSIEILTNINEEKIIKVDSPYTISKDFFCVTGDYEENVLYNNYFIRKSFEEKIDSISIQLKRNLDYIKCFISNQLISPINGFIITHYNVYKAINYKNRIDYDYLDISIGATSSDNSDKIILQEKYKMLAATEMYVTINKSNSTEDNLYSLFIDNIIQNSLYSNITNTTKEYDISLYSNTPDGGVDSTGMYQIPLIFNIQLERCPTSSRKLEIRDTISYTAASGIRVDLYENRDTGSSFIFGWVESINYPHNALTNQIGINSLSFYEVLPTTTYFGNNIIIFKKDIPFNEMEVMLTAPQSCTDYYDFYGMYYKTYNKINFTSKTTNKNQSKIQNQIGIRAENITTDILNTISSYIKQIDFMYRFDDINSENNTDESFSLKILYGTDYSEELELMNQSILTKNGKWQYISIIFNIDNTFDVRVYNQNTSSYDTIHAAPNTLPPLKPCKLSINNIMWNICGIMVFDDNSTTYETEALDFVNKQNILLISNNTTYPYFYIPLGKYYYYNEDFTKDIKRKDCVSLKGVNEIPVLYGKFQEIALRDTVDDFIFRERIYYIQNNCTSAKLMTPMEKEINESVSKIDIKVYCQKLGANELDNPIIILSNLTTKFFGQPKEYSDIRYIGCLVDDLTDDSLLIEEYTNKRILSYNNNLPENGYEYEAGSLAIMGRQVVLLKRILDSVNDIIIDNKRYRIIELDVNGMENNLYGYNQFTIPYHLENENIRSVYDFSEIVSSYEFTDSICEGENDTFKINRVSGSCYLKDSIYKFNKFYQGLDKYIIDKGCAVYLFEGSQFNPILQSTMFIENIVLDAKENDIQISLKNKLDLIYDNKIINYKTLEDYSIQDTIIEILYPYYNMNKNNVIYSCSTYLIQEKIENIKTIQLASYNTIGDVLDAICECGINIYTDEMERIVINITPYSKYISNNNQLELYGNYMTNTDGNIKTVDYNIIELGSSDELTDDIYISERDSLLINKVDIEHENTVPMYERNEYVLNDKIYPINCFKIQDDVSYTNTSNVITLSSDNINTPVVQEIIVSSEDFNSIKSKIGVMCVLRRDNYELQYKLIKVSKESV